MSAPLLSDLSDIEKIQLYERAVDIARLSPSSHNDQPWRFRITPELIEIVVDSAPRNNAMGTAKLSKSALDERGRIISCGCALFYLILSLRQEGYHERITLFPEGDQSNVVAQVWAVDASKRLNNDDLLFASIMRRRTNRLPFFPRALPSRLVSRLRSAASEEYCELYPLMHEHRETLVELLRESAHLHEDIEELRQEAALWREARLASGRRLQTPSPKMDSSSLDLQASESSLHLCPKMSLENGNGNALLPVYKTAIAEAPLLAVLTTEGDSKRDWIMAGQSLAHILLLAAHESVSASFLNEPIHIPHQREKVATLLGVNEIPQIILALGYAPLGRPSSRYELSELLLETD